MFRPAAWPSIVLAVALSALLLSLNASSQITEDEFNSTTIDARIGKELAVFGGRGALIGQARADVLEILSSQGDCAIWFQEVEVEPNIAKVFRSVHYELRDGTAQVILRPDASGTAWFKHPWGATTTEDGGKDSSIAINTHGPFFVHETRLMKVNTTSGFNWPAGWHPVMVGPYVGDTAEARMTILLHELGHIVGRLPIDDGSWDGRSARNTVEVLQHCKAEIQLLARKRRATARAWPQNHSAHHESLQETISGGRSSE